MTDADLVDRPQRVKIEARTMEVIRLADLPWDELGTDTLIAFAKALDSMQVMAYVEGRVFEQHRRVR